MIAMKPPHKFFEVIMENDLAKLLNFLIIKQGQILSGEIPGFPKDKLEKYDKFNGPTTQLGDYYNIFDKEYFGDDALRDLHRELRGAVKKACEYYGIDYDSQQYIIHGWYNLDYKSGDTGGVSPLNHEENFHDHMAGEGAPFFHGYYCVNAEPSSTWYKINGIDLFENVNKNNRAIVSETGHPHGRDDWYDEVPRVTIAYDIKPSVGEDIPENWIIL
jgi:hypothetical protein